MAQHGRRLLPGIVHVAPAGLNTVLRPGLRVELRDPAGRAVPRARRRRGVHQRCGDLRRRRRSASCSPAWAATAPTGLRTMREAGAMTIGQDEPTSVVWGMPAAAQALDAVEAELPLPAIAAAIVTAVTVAVAEDGVGA